MHDWVTHVRIDENPVNKGDTISALTRRAKETASQNALRWGSKNDSNKDLVVVWCHATEYVSRLDLCKYYSLYGNMWKLILQSRTLSLCSKSSMKYLEEEPALQRRRQSARRTRRHWSLVQGLLRESWIRGCQDSQTIPSAGLLDYEDTRLKTSSRVQKGLSLAWKASLAIQICRSPTIVTDSV